MNVKPAALVAHIRLMETLPTSQIRTHICADERGNGGHAKRRSKLDTDQLNYKIKALKRKGLPNLEIAAECGVTPTTVSKHLRGYIRPRHR